MQHPTCTLGEPLSNSLCLGICRPIHTGSVMNPDLETGIATREWDHIAVFSSGFYKQYHKVCFVWCSVVEESRYVHTSICNEEKENWIGEQQIE